TPQSPVTAQPPAPPSAPPSPKAPWWRTYFHGIEPGWIFTALAILLVGTLFGTLLLGGAGRGGTTVAGPSATPDLKGVNTPHTVYDATAPVAASGDSVNIALDVSEGKLGIAPNVTYQAWMYGKTVPGPVLRVRQGQTVHFTLTNSGQIAHSIDFHAAQTPPDQNYVSVLPGKSLSFTFKANYPGIFMYHCGTPTVAHHMANGMYGAIIVDPANGWSPAREYVLVQSEFYPKKNADGTFGLDTDAIMTGQPPAFVVFNGYANQYKDNPLPAKAGEKIRLFVLNAGPTDFSAFHVIGAILSDVYADGNPANHTVGQQTVTIPPGGGTVLELTIPEAGSYAFVTHSFSDAMKGAIGVLKVS
ncbi:MAG TPA: multicopper oxidase domain-containing protein, partial [Ktedonobacterales bacterium]